MAEYNQVLQVLGGDGFEVEDTGIAKMPREGNLREFAEMNQDAYYRALEWFCESESESDGELRMGSFLCQK